MKGLFRTRFMVQTKKRNTPSVSFKKVFSQEIGQMRYVIFQSTIYFDIDITANRSVWPIVWNVCVAELLKRTETWDYQCSQTSSIIYLL